MDPVPDIQGYMQVRSRQSALRHRGGSGVYRLREGLGQVAGAH